MLNDIRAHKRAGWSGLLLLLVSCGLSDESKPSGPLTIHTGRTMIDTIEAVQRIRVKVPVPVPDSGGVPLLSGYRVTWENPESNGARQSPAAMPVGESGVGAFLSDTTNAEGEVEADIYFGERAGSSHIRILVDALNLVDSVEIQTLPGGPWEVAVEPRDTVVAQGGTFRVRRVLVADRWGNPVADQVRLRSVDGITSISGMDVRGLQFGTGTVEAYAGKGVTPLWVSVAPNGFVSFVHADRIRITRTDGHQQTTIALPGFTSQPAISDWSPDGKTLVFDGLGVVTEAGAFRVLGDTAFYGRRGPEFSADGQWVYYTAQEPQSGKWHGRRIRLDGTRDSTLVVGGERLPAPSPSPDGTKVAYIGASDDLRILDLATGTSISIYPDASAPSWSPSGDRLAFLAGGPGSGYLTLIAPDGTALVPTQISLHPMFSIDWSPDGRWVIGTAERSTGPLIADPMNGVTASLASIALNGRAPAWKPK